MEDHIIHMDTTQGPVRLYPCKFKYLTLTGIEGFTDCKVIAGGMEVYVSLEILEKLVAYLYESGEGEMAGWIEDLRVDDAELTSIQCVPAIDVDSPYVVDWAGNMVSMS